MTSVRNIFYELLNLRLFNTKQKLTLIRIICDFIKKKFKQLLLFIQTCKDATFVSRAKDLYLK